MPASKRDVIDATKEAVDAIDAQVVAAFELKNTSSVANSARMTDVINALNAQRTEIVLQDFKIAAGSRAMQAALDKIRAATKEMNETAAKMKTVTSFISNLAAFVGAGAKVVSALQGF